jgi:transposase InsO family protein
MEYTEGEIRMATLIALNASRTGTLTTSQLILALESFMRPRGKDAQIARDRSDTYFSQKVRNLISHRDAGTSLMARGLVQYDAVNETLTITAAGRQACSF